MPWSSQAVIAETVIVEGPSGGIFTYDASGNLRTANVSQTTTDPNQGITCYAGFNTFNGHGAVISLFSSTLDAQLWYADTGSSTQGALADSIASASGTDPFGNTFRAGTTSYSGTTVSQLNTARLFLGVTTDPSLAQLTGGGGVLELDSGQGSIADLQASILLKDSGASPTGSPLAIVSQQCVVGSVSPGSAANLESASTMATGRLDVTPAATAPPARPTGTEPWNTLTSLGYQNSWADSGTNIPGRYRLVASPPATVEIEGDLTVGTVADGTLIVTLPAAYRPTHSQIIRLVVPSGVPTNPGNMRLTVGTDGTIKCTSLAGLASPNRVYFHDFISLD